MLATFSAALKSSSLEQSSQYLLYPRHRVFVLLNPFQEAQECKRVFVGRNGLQSDLFSGYLAI